MSLYLVNNHQREGDKGGGLLEIREVRVLVIGLKRPKSEAKIKAFEN
jgi:hypothetical protein